MKAAIYVVNLERAVIRRATIRKELEAAGVEATFLPGVDKKNIGRDVLLKRFERFGPWGLVPYADMCCCLSHRQIWEHFLETDNDLALIFEDDAFVAPEVGEWIRDLSWWPKDADIVKLERWHSRTMRQVVGKTGRIFAGRKISRLYSRHPGTAGYIISKSHVLSLLRIEKIPVAVDQLLFNPYVSSVARNARIYQVNPALVEQGNDPGKEQTIRGAERKPKGWKSLRQKIRRGRAELCAGFIHFFRILTGQAELLRLGFSTEPINAPNSANTRN